MTAKIVIVPMALLLIVSMVGDVGMAGAVVAGFLGGLVVGFILFRRYRIAMEDEEAVIAEALERRHTVICKQCGSSCFEDFVDSEGRLALVCCECGAAAVVLEAAVEEAFF